MQANIIFSSSKHIFEFYLTKWHSTALSSMRGVLKWHLPTYPFVKLTEHGFVVCRVDNFQPDVEALIYMIGIVIISCHA